MRAEDVVELVEAWDGAGIDVWLDGGWGVDALLTEQTREHDDLDIVVSVDHLPGLLVLLAKRGFVTIKPWPDSPEGIVVADATDRRVDIHPLRFETDGNAVQRIEGGEWTYPSEGFTGRGVVAGRSVPCLSAEVQVLCHAGYELQNDDIHDLSALHERLGVKLLPFQEQAIAKAGTP